MINIAIVDDDRIMQTFLTTIINKHLIKESTEYTIRTFGETQTFLHELSINLFEIVLLDIEIPDMNGIALSKRMQEISEDSIIIFITSYEHYIKDAFGINVFDYILKEECQAKLPSAISTILKKMNNKKERYCFKTHEGLRTFNLNDLISIELQYNRTLLMMTKRKEHILSSTSLTKLYRLIASPQICRPNSHHLVNMNYIDEIYKGEIRLKGIAKSIVISRGKYKEIYELYMNYLIEKEL